MYDGDSGLFKQWKLGLGQGHNRGSNFYIENILSDIIFSVMQWTLKFVYMLTLGPGQGHNWSLGFSYDYIGRIFKKLPLKNHQCTMYTYP